MKVLLTGASGFIGGRLAAALVARGHVVVGTSRHARPHGGIRWARLDLAEAVEPAAWSPWLQGIDIVVNAAGVFQQHGRATFTAVHRDAPRALFEACAQARVRRVVQLSALAGPQAAGVAFVATKHAADAVLLALPVDGVVVRPSLVFGADGTSSAMLLSLASAPVIALPPLDDGIVQPVHVDDLVHALCALVEGARTERCVAIVGPRAMPLRDYLLSLRRSMGLGSAPVWRLPRGVSVAATRLGDRLPHAWLTSDSLRLLEAGSHADPHATVALLGRPPRAPDQFIDAAVRTPLRTHALLGWCLPMLRLAIAFVWIATAIVSFGLYPVDDSLAMLSRVGVPSAWQPLLLYGAAGMDLLLGVLTLAAPSRALWRTQIALMLFYMLLIAWRLPEQWLHPFGPLTKNVPMLAALVLLDALTPPRRPRWNT